MKRVKGTEEGQDWKARALLPLPLEEPATSSLVTWSHHRDETSTSDGEHKWTLMLPPLCLEAVLDLDSPHHLCLTYTTLLCK